MDHQKYSSAMRLPAMTYSLSRACSWQPPSLSPCGSAGGTAALPLALVGVEEGRGWEVEERLVGCRWVVVCVFLWPSLQLLNEANTTWSVTGSGLSTTTCMENTYYQRHSQHYIFFLTYTACFVAWLMCQPLRGKIIGSTASICTVNDKQNERLLTFDAEPSWLADAVFLEAGAEPAVRAVPSIVCWMIVFCNSYWAWYINWV